MSSKENLSDLSIFMDRLTSHSFFSGGSFSKLIEDTSEEVAFKMLARFHQSLGESIHKIREGMKTQQGDLVWHSSHRVAGTAELLGFRELGKFSKSLTQSLRAAPEFDTHIEDINSYLKDAEEVYVGIARGCPNLAYYL